MPGIVGLITPLPRQNAEAQLHRMLSTLCYESSYVSGTWCDEDLGVYVGWVARKGSFAEAMPVHNETGNLVLIISGEEFPKPGTESMLRERGHRIADGAASYLVHLAEEMKEFPKSLNGRFHGILVDRTARQVAIFNDRYGMHRVYYHEGPDAFVFSAEAKAILAIRPDLRTTDPHGLAEFIVCGCTLENRTIFKGIQVLPPASQWTFQRGTLSAKKSAYFDPKEWEEQSVLDVETYYQELRDVFARNLPRYFGGAEKVGISLTGGLDTRMIVSWIRPEPRSLPCYSFGGMYRDSQDVSIARRVARECQQTHEVIGVGQEFLSEFPRYAERTVFISDGCVEVQHSPDLYVNERAARIAPVRMTGNYGGEVLRRVRAFKPIDPQKGIFDESLDGNLKEAKATYSRLIVGHPLSFALFRQAPWHHYSLLCLEQSQLSLRSPYLDNDFVRTVFRAPQSTLVNNEISLRLIGDGNPALRRIRTDRGLAGALPDALASAQQKYLEFTFKAEYAYDYGMPQSIARVDHALSRFHLERVFLGRHKFFHFRVWYRDFLAEYVREMLLDSRTLSRPYLKRSSVEEVVNGHLKGGRNYTTEITRLLTLELLHRQLVDGNN